MKTPFESIDRLAGQLAFHRERHSLLSGNLANMETPGYRPKDLRPPDPASAPVELATTEAGHLQGAGGVVHAGTPFTDSGAEPGPDGNAVNLERELAKIDANRVRSATMSELVSRRLALLKYCATDGGG